MTINTVGGWLLVDKSHGETYARLLMSREVTQQFKNNGMVPMFKLLILVSKNKSVNAQYYAVMATDYSFTPQSCGWPPRMIVSAVQSAHNSQVMPMLYVHAGSSSRTISVSLSVAVSTVVVNAVYGITSLETPLVPISSLPNVLHFPWDRGKFIKEKCYALRKMRTVVAKLSLGRERGKSEVRYL